MVSMVGMVGSFSRVVCKRCYTLLQYSQTDIQTKLGSVWDVDYTLYYIKCLKCSSVVEVSKISDAT
jgi:RNase P subunit RPR2